MYSELDIFKQFRQVIVWGFPLHSHTHSYIHGAWVKTFRHIGINVYWFDDKNYPRDFDYSNSCFITEGWADDNIPINSTSTYFVHIAKNPARYIDQGARLIEIRYNVLEINDFNYNYKLPINAVNLSRDTLYEVVKDDSAVAYARGREVSNKSYEAIYMYWATDLLPHEFNYDDAAAEHQRKIHYLGSVGGDHPANEFKHIAEKAGINVVINNPWTNPVSYDENIRLMKESYCSPDFRSHGDADKHHQYGKMNGTNHIDIGYIPCRVLKAISYGHTGITNSPRVKEILGDYVEYAAKPSDVLPIVEHRKNDIEWRKTCMKHIAENHTFLQRVRDLARALMMKNSTLTCVTSLYNIGRESCDGRSMQDYIKWLKKTLITFKDPIVLYLDESLHMRDELLNVRSSIGPIQIIETPLSMIPMWSYKDKIEQILNDDMFISSVKYPNDITNKLPGYTMIQYSKFGFLQNTIQDNIFKSTYFCWIDAGISRFTTQYKHIKINDHNESTFIIQTNNKEQLSTITYNNYIGTNECILKGTMWVMSASSFYPVKNEVMRIWNEEMVDKKCIDNEQIALALAYKNIQQHVTIINDSTQINGILTTYFTCY